MFCRVAVCLLLALFAVSAVAARRKPYFVYNKLPVKYIIAAREYGASLHDEFLKATENATSGENMEAYSNFFEGCNNLGWEFAANVTGMLKKIPRNDNFLILLKTGIKPFAAKFLTLEDSKLQLGIDQLCTKAEMQFQCQLGFGESRAQIMYRIQSLRRYDGDMRLLLENDCVDKKHEAINYRCIGKEVAKWSAPCQKSLDEYNQTRVELNNKIVATHLRALEHVNRIVRESNATDEEVFLPTKIIAENVMKKALSKIVEYESTKCRRLDTMVSCVLPALEQQCGWQAMKVLKTSILVGYLRNERSEALQLMFEQLMVDNDPLCTALNPDV